MITSALRQKVQGAGKIAKQIFMVVALCTNGDEAPRKNTQALNANTKRKHQTLTLNASTNGGDASRIGASGHFQ